MIIFPLCLSVCVSVCLSVCRIANSCGQILRTVFGEVGCLTSTDWLDSGVDLDRDADTGSFQGTFTICRKGAVLQILLMSREVVDEFL